MIHFSMVLSSVDARSERRVRDLIVLCVGRHRAWTIALTHVLEVAGNLRFCRWAGLSRGCLGLRRLCLRRGRLKEAAREGLAGPRQSAATPEAGLTTVAVLATATLAATTLAATALATTTLATATLAGAIPQTEVE